MADFTAQAAADTALIDRGDGVVLQRVGVIFHRQAWTSGKPDAGMIARTDRRIDAEPRSHHPAAALHNPKLRSTIEDDFRRLPSLVESATVQEAGPAEVADETKQLSLFD